MTLMGMLYVVQVLLVVMFPMIYQSNASAIWKGYDYADKIPINTWLQQLEDMTSDCGDVDVVIISRACMALRNPLIA